MRTKYFKCKIDQYEMEWGFFIWVMRNELYNLKFGRYIMITWSRTVLSMNQLGFFGFGEAHLSSELIFVFIRNRKNQKEQSVV